MEPLLESLGQFVSAGGDVLSSLGALLLPWTPLGAWIVFWLFGVDWVKFRQVLLAGGWVGVVLIGLVMALVWEMIAPAAEGTYSILGLEPSGFVGKTVLVTGLFCVALLCGAVQLSGCCGVCRSFAEEDADLDSH